MESSGPVTRSKARIAGAVAAPAPSPAPKSTTRRRTVKKDEDPGVQDLLTTQLLKTNLFEPPQEAQNEAPAVSDMPEHPTVPVEPPAGAAMMDGGDASDILKVPFTIQESELSGQHLQSVALPDSEDTSMAQPTQADVMEIEEKLAPTQLTAADRLDDATNAVPVPSRFDQSVESPLGMVAAFTSILEPAFGSEVGTPINAPVLSSAATDTKTAGSFHFGPVPDSSSSPVMFAIAGITPITSTPGAPAHVATTPVSSTPLVLMGSPVEGAAATQPLSMPRCSVPLQDQTPMSVSDSPILADDPFSCSPALYTPATLPAAYTPSTPYEGLEGGGLEYKYSPLQDTGSIQDRPVEGEVTPGNTPELSPSSRPLHMGEAAEPLEQLYNETADDPMLDGDGSTNPAATPLTDMAVDLEGSLADDMLVAEGESSPTVQTAAYEADRREEVSSVFMDGSDAFSFPVPGSPDAVPTPTAVVTNASPANRLLGSAVRVPMAANSYTPSTSSVKLNTANKTPAAYATATGARPSPAPSAKAASAVTPASKVPTPTEPSYVHVESKVKAMIARPSTANEQFATPAASTVKFAPATSVLTADKLPVKTPATIGGASMSTATKRVSISTPGTSKAPLTGAKVIPRTPYPRSATRETIPEADVIEQGDEGAMEEPKDNASGGGDFMDSELPDTQDATSPSKLRKFSKKDKYAEADRQLQRYQSLDQGAPSYMAATAASQAKTGATPNAVPKLKSVIVASPNLDLRSMKQLKRELKAKTAAKLAKEKVRSEEAAVARVDSTTQMRTSKLTPKAEDLVQLGSGDDSETDEAEYDQAAELLLTKSMDQLTVGSRRAIQPLKGLPLPQGQHVRFDDKGRAVPSPSSGKTLLRGLPAPAGTHKRFD